MNVPAKIEKPMLLEFMADKYGLRPQEFADTVRKTCGMPTATNEEFAAFLMVCRQYDLNPILREVYAFPKRGGGIVPIVGIDGWLNLINAQRECDGFEFDIHHDQQGELVSMTCRLYRKDRSHPVEVTEYLSECIRPTDPWKMKHRMLRHKTLMQAARYAFGFSGIYDEDEGARMAEAPQITPPAAPRPPRPPVTPERAAENLAKGAEAMEQLKAERSYRKKPKKPEPEEEEEEITFNTSPLPADLLSALDADLENANTPEEVEEHWEAHDILAALESMPQGEQFQSVAQSIKRKHHNRVATKSKDV